MARRPERNFFEQLRRNLPKNGPPMDLQRIENTTCNGVADVSYCIGGVDGWAELKAWERVRLTGRFTIPKLREEQAAWLHRRASLGGRSYLLMRVNRDVVLIDGRLVPALFDKTLHLDWTLGSAICNLWLKHPVSWSTLVQALIDPPVSDETITSRLKLFGRRVISPRETPL